MYISANSKRIEQKYEMLTTCILRSVSAETWAELHIVYDDFNIDGMIYFELVFNGLMNKAIIINTHMTRYLQDKYDNLPSYMTSCYSGIAKFILEWRNLVSFLEAHGLVITNKFNILWRAFELCKDVYFVEYMGHNQEAHNTEKSQHLHSLLASSWSSHWTSILIYPKSTTMSGVRRPRGRRNISPLWPRWSPWRTI